MDQDAKLMQKVFRKIPEELQEVVASMEMVDSVRAPAKSAGLSEEQVDKIEIASLTILLGMEKPENLGEKIKSFGINDEIARKVASELDKTVFFPIRDLLSVAQVKYKEVLAGTKTGKTIASVLFAKNNKQI